MVGFFLIKSLSVEKKTTDCSEVLKESKELIDEGKDINRAYNLLEKNPQCANTNQKDSIRKRAYYYNNFAIAAHELNRKKRAKEYAQRSLDEHKKWQEKDARQATKEGYGWLLIDMEDIIQDNE